MIDYYETRSQPITRVMVWEAYRRVKQNRGSMGIDQMSWGDLEKDQKQQLYKLWNRLSSGSYYPPPVKEVGIKKKDGGIRKLGIPTILDRIAQEVVRSKLNNQVEGLFHNSSYGYRKGRNAHQAIEQATKNAMRYDWAIDLDIKGFFDNIDHEMLMKAVQWYSKDKWISMYVARWLKAGIAQENGIEIDRQTGTPQGGVVSPLLANIFLHVIFDKWMEKYHPEKPFERYADDIVIHCKTEKQALFMRREIVRRMEECKLQVHPQKTKVVNLRGRTESKYPRSLDFLGYTLKLQLVRAKTGLKLMPTAVISRKSRSSIMDKLKSMKLHRKRKSIEEIAAMLNPKLQGWINYYCKFWTGHTHHLWHLVNVRLVKWVRWEKGLSRRAAVKWLHNKWSLQPMLFAHWKLVHP